MSFNSSRLVQHTRGIGSDNGLSPIRRQAIIWTNAELLSIGPLGTNFGEILPRIQNFSFTKMHLKISSAKRRPFCRGGGGGGELNGLDFELNGLDLPKD